MAAGEPDIMRRGHDAEETLAALAMWLLLAKGASLPQIASHLGVSEDHARRRLRKAIGRAVAAYSRLGGAPRHGRAPFRWHKPPDAVTGVPTRSAGERFLADCLDYARRAGWSWSVAFVDVDGLKAINDRHGHAAGDRQLWAVAQAMQQALRKTDRVFRWGGDEFLAVLPGTDAAVAGQLAVRLRRQLEPLGVSIGVASWSGGEPWEAVVQRADQAMYQEKRRHHAALREGRPLPMAEGKRGSW